MAPHLPGNHLGGAPHRHYLDHASTTPLRPEVVEALVAWATAGPVADPARAYAEGGAVRSAIEASREDVAAFLGVRPREVVFTSGGTEAANWATISARAAAEPGAPVVLAPVEHAAVRRSAEASGPVELLLVDRCGRIDVDHLAELLKPRPARPRPALVHFQHASHEVGTLQPVAHAAALCRAAGVPLHVDACASAGHVPVRDPLEASLVSVSAHKLGGPPGVGALLLRRGARLAPLLVGADQERARRAGFENVLAIVGFAAAARALAAPGALDAEAARASHHRDALTEVATGVDGVTPYGDTARRLPHVATFGLDAVAGEGVVLALDRAGIAAHSGSACSAEAFEPSPILEAMGLDATSSLRLSVGWSTTDEDVAAFADAFPRVVGSLRRLASSA